MIIVDVLNDVVIAVHKIYAGSVSSNIEGVVSYQLSDTENSPAIGATVTVENGIPTFIPPLAKTVISSDDVRKNLTFAEKAKWDSEKTPEIVTAKIEFAQPLEVEPATEVLQFLVDSGSISQASMDKVIGGNNAI